MLEIARGQESRGSGRNIPASTGTQDAVRGSCENAGRANDVSSVVSANRVAHKVRVCMQALQKVACRLELAEWLYAH